MISILCCYNDEKCFNTMLKGSLQKQSVDYQLIGINNHNGKYSSAAAAYNDKIREAIGEIVVFCHQDIAFDDSDFLSDVENCFKSNSNIILGLAGIKKDSVVSSNLQYYKTKSFITRRRVEDDIELVESVDECFIALEKKQFNALLFNDAVCDGWHLYGVELCYRAKHGPDHLRPVVFSKQAYHKVDNENGLEVDFKFLHCIKMLCKEFSTVEEKIYAPCFVISTNPLLRNIKIIKTKIRLMIEKRLR